MAPRQGHTIFVKADEKVAQMYGGLDNFITHSLTSSLTVYLLTLL